MLLPAIVATVVSIVVSSLYATFSVGVLLGFAYLYDFLGISANVDLWVGGLIALTYVLAVYFFVWTHEAVRTSPVYLGWE